MLFAIMYFSVSVIGDLIPFMLIVDTKFIKIFTFDLIRKFKQSEFKSQDLENALLVKDQE